MILTQATDALAAKHFHLVFQHCTNLISNDPKGPFGEKARAMLEQIDERTSELATTRQGKSHRRARTRAVARSAPGARKVLAPLAGTRWAGDIDALHLQILIATNFLEEIEAARKKKAAAGENVPIVSASKKFEGTLVGLNGLTARVQSGQAELPLSLRHIETGDFIDLLDALNLADRHAELSCLWFLLGRLDAAASESEAALKKPGTIPMAATLAGLLANSKNLHLYDFNGWRQQLDWEAVLRKLVDARRKIRARIRRRRRNISEARKHRRRVPLRQGAPRFRSRIRAPAAGWFFICTLGDDKHAAEMVITETDVTLQEKFGKRSLAVPFKVGAKGAPARADISVDGDTATLQLNGRPAGTISISGLSNFTGTLTLQAHQCACAIDNVVLRSQK